MRPWCRRFPSLPVSARLVLTGALLLGALLVLPRSPGGVGARGASGPLEPLLQISDLDHDQVESAVAYAPPRDEALVVWTNDWPGNDDLYAQRVSASGELVGGWFAVSFGAGAERRRPAVAYNTRTDAYIVVWEHDDGTTAHVRARLVGGSGQLLGPEVPVSGTAPPTRAAVRPAVAYGSTSDRYVVVWEHYASGAISADIEAVALQPSLAPDGARFLVARGTTSESHERPDLAYNRARNELLVAWQLASGGANDIHGRRVKLTDGPGTLGPAFPVAAWGNVETSPAVAALPVPAGIGQYVVLYRTEVGGSGSIQGQRVTGTGALEGPRVQVGGSTSPPAPPPDLVEPAIAADEAAEAYLAVWSRTHPLISQQTLEGRRLDAAGNHLDPETDLGGHVAQRPAVAAGGEGSYLVAYDDRPPPAANRDVFGRRWGPEAPTATATAPASATPSPTHTPTREPTATPSATATATVAPPIASSTPTSPVPTASATLTPLPTLPGDCVELVRNGDFESGSFAPEWGRFGATRIGVGRQSAFGAQLGAQDNAAGEVSQTIGIPAEARPVRLHFWWLVDGDREQTADVVGVYAVDGDVAHGLAALRAVEPFGIWAPVELDLTRLAGRWISLAFLVTTDAQHPSVFTVDDVSLKACGPAAVTPTGTWTPIATAATRATPSPTPTDATTRTPTPATGRTFLPVLTRAGSDGRASSVGTGRDAVPVDGPRSARAAPPPQVVARLP